MKVTQIPKEKMNLDFLENLHFSIFEQRVPASYFKYDTCLIVQDDSGDLITYSLIKEICPYTVELIWGGTDKLKRGIKSFKATKLLVEECLKHFKTVTFQTWNRNHKMIKLGLGIGFNIIGCKQSSDGIVYLILNKERG